jgi:hypothetical protein
LTQGLLPKSDLARIAPIVPENKPRYLQEFLSAFRPRVSYLSFLRSVPGMLGADGDPGLALERASLIGVEATIRQRAARLSEKDCKTEINMNIGAARGFETFVNDRVGQARKHDFGALALVGSISVDFTIDVLLEIDGRKTILSIDPRASAKKLDDLGRRFAFSCMHEKTRMLDPLVFGDFALGILQFGPTDGVAERTPTLHWDDDIKLFSMAELTEMTIDTYDQLAQMRAVAMQNDQRATGTDGFI